MCSMSVLCPLCCSTKFSSIDALRVSLIKAANGPLQCPLCQEMFLGLDKLTIHLFSHSSLMENAAEKVEAVDKCKEENILSSGNTTSTAVAPSNTGTREKKPKKNKETAKPALSAPAESISPTNQNESNSILSTCDICEFSFRNSVLRDMHVRLVHQNLNAQLQNSNSSAQQTSPVPDFKCHLCAKTFKMKGSLRVHLKVVHHMAYVNNTPKLSICDRIRHKESKSLNKSTSSSKLNLISSSLYEECPSYPLSTVNPLIVPTQSNLSPLNADNLSPNLMNINDQGDLVNCSLGDEPMSSNVLLVFNSSSNMSLNMGLLNDLESEETTTAKSSSTDTNPKIWECDVCSKAFTTKYFLKKHKRLHTGKLNKKNV